MGRATQGVKLINLKGNDEIAAVAKVFRDNDEEEDEENSDAIRTPTPGSEEEE